MLSETLEYIKLNPNSFNQKIWVNPQKTEGCFAWHVVNLFGAPDQKKAFTWDAYYPHRIACEVLNIKPSEGERLFWAMNTIDDIESIINKRITP